MDPSTPEAPVHPFTAEAPANPFTAEAPVDPFTAEAPITAPLVQGIPGPLVKGSPGSSVQGGEGAVSDSADETSADETLGGGARVNRTGVEDTGGELRVNADNTGGERRGVRRSVSVAEPWEGIAYENEFPPVVVMVVEVCSQVSSTHRSCVP